MTRSRRWASSPSFLLRVSLGLAVASVVFGTWIDLTTASGADVWGYDLAKGTDENDIRRKFNLHRGRWWNYYERGSWYLRYEHYQAAERDFRVVIGKRPTDKRGARTYGMHFRDCFGHRELGIALYHLALGAESEEKELSFLVESIRELDRSLGQVKSARAEYFRNLAIGKRWKAGANEEKDITPPVIQVENETKIDENLNVLYTNQQTVRVDIRVADDKSGVGAIWVNERELLVERAEPNILKTEYVRVDANDPWIRLRAGDLVGNVNRVPVEVQVVQDWIPPGIFTTADAAQMTPNGLIAVECTARDEVGLSTVQVNNKRIDCSHRRDFNVLAKIPPGPDPSRVEIWATDLAGNITKGHLNVSTEGGRTAQPVAVVPRLVRPVYFAELFPAPRVWPRVSPAFLRDGLFSPAVMRAAAQNSQEMYFDSPVRRAVVSRVGSVEPTPVLEFTNYVDEPGGVRVVGTEFEIYITLKHAAGVEWIELNGRKTHINRWSSEANEFEYISPTIRFEAYGENRVEVKAFSADGFQVGETTDLVFRTVPNATRELESLYSVIVLPLVPNILSNDNRPDGLYRDMRDATIDCRLFPNGPPRFNTAIMESLEPRELEMDLGYPRPQAIKIGRKRGVDLSVFGEVTDHRKFWGVSVSLVGNEPGRRVFKTLGDLHLPKDPDHWSMYIDSFKEKLQEALPRIQGKVTVLGPGETRMLIGVGREMQLFRGQKLCVFKQEGRRLGARLAEAVVDRIGLELESQARITKSDLPLGSALTDFRLDQLIIMTK